MKIEDLLSNDLFVRWVKEPDSQSEQYWTDWLSKHPERANDVRSAREIIQSMTYKHQHKLDEITHNKLFENIKAFEKNLDRDNEFIQHKIKPSKSRFWMMGIAAALLLLFTTLTYYYISTGNKVSYENAFLSAKTSKEQRKKVLLPDGSVVHLNAGSFLKYPAQFSDNERVVFLQGEAFFEVRRNTKKPFMVITGDVKTTVLGTSFDINAYKNGKSIRVSVLTGKVKMQHSKEEFIILNPNQQGKWTDGKLNTSIVDSKGLLKWKDGILSFDKAGFDEVFEKIENWYGVKITIEDKTSLKGNYTGEFKEESLENVLEGISFTSNFQYEIDGNKITIFN